VVCAVAVAVAATIPFSEKKTKQQRDRMAFLNNNEWGSLLISINLTTYFLLTDDRIKVV
jgi:hypothetical protein